MSKKKAEGTNLLYQLMSEARSYDDVIVMGARRSRLRYAGAYRRRRQRRHDQPPCGL